MKLKTVENYFILSELTTCLKVEFVLQQEFNNHNFGHNFGPCRDRRFSGDGTIPLVCPSFYQISFSSKFNLVMFKIEPVNLHEQFASDYLRLLKIYYKKKAVSACVWDKSLISTSCSIVNNLFYILDFLHRCKREVLYAGSVRPSVDHYNKPRL